MSLLRRVSNDFAWPSLLPDRPFFDFDREWMDLMTETTIRVDAFRENGQTVVRAEAPGADPEKDIKANYKDGILEARIPMIAS